MTAKRIMIKDKTFELTIPETKILEAVKTVARTIENDYKDKEPVLVIVLNGAFVFAGDLIRMLDIPCQITFTKLSSYDGIASSGKIAEQLPVTDSLKGRHVIIIEDIVETGYTMQFLLSRIQSQHPASVEICALSYKPEKCKVNGLRVKYVGMTLPEAFIVGYGLDYDQHGRELRDIYSLVENTD